MGFYNQDNFIGGNPEEQPVLMTLIILLLFIVVGATIGVGLIAGLAYIEGINTQEIVTIVNKDNSLDNRNIVRSVLLINHLTMFILPGIFFAHLFYKNNWARFLHLTKIPLVKNIGLGVLIMLVAIPFVQLSYWMNQQIPLPKWAMTMENSTSELIEKLLVVEAPYELLFNILVVAIIPAFSEEIIFRGIVQQKLTNTMSNPHVAIWLTGFIFSAIHMQFEGFIPRLILGALLGYLFYWTKNLWIPILAHFVNNAAQIIIQFLYSREISSIDLDKADEMPWGFGIISLIFVLVLGYYMRNNNNNIAPKGSQQDEIA